MLMTLPHNPTPDLTTAPDKISLTVYAERPTEITICVDPVTARAVAADLVSLAAVVERAQDGVNRG